ncbi:hypothetical protein CLU79DRAFT_830657 [Phycomyces nitens]|nr:hypothetical protein CLU79DRAFT_830657 [Phycomyces nitens]
MWGSVAATDYQNDFIEAFLQTEVKPASAAEQPHLDMSQDWSVQTDQFLDQNVSVSSMDPAYSALYNIMKSSPTYLEDSKMLGPAASAEVFTNNVPQASITSSVPLPALPFNTIMTNQPFDTEFYSGGLNYDPNQIGYNTQESESPYDYTSAFSSLSPPEFQMSQSLTDSAGESPYFSNFASSPTRPMTPPPTSTNNADSGSFASVPISTKSDDRGASKKRNSRRRSSTSTSVAARVALAINEPVDSVDSGIPHITFVYSANRVEKHYKIRVDIDNVDISSLPLQYRKVNAVYPRALCAKQDYKGNRWKYETECNEQGWKLTSLNQDALCGSRGLIQRSVDCFRNSRPEMRSRRVSRQVKVNNGTLRRRRTKQSTKD